MKEQRRKGKRIYPEEISTTSRVAAIIEREGRPHRKKKGGVISAAAWGRTRFRSCAEVNVEKGPTPHRKAGKGTI